MAPGLALAGWLATGAPWVAAQTPVHKCVINGTVTFQRDPCPSGVPPPPPKSRLASADHQIAPVSASISQMAIPAAPSARESRSSLWCARRSAS